MAAQEPSPVSPQHPLFPMKRSARNAALTAVVIAVLGGMMIDELATERSTTPPRVALVYGIVTSVTAIVAWYWWQRKRWRATESKTDASTRVVMAVVTAVLAIRFAEWSWAAGRAPGAAAVPAAVVGVWSALLLLSVLRPLAEEAVLRGYLLRHLRATGSERGIVLVSVALSVLIAGSLTHAASNAALAAMLTLVVLRTERLWLAAIAHVFIAVLGEAMRQTGFASAPIALVAPTMSVLAAGAVIAFTTVLRDTPWDEQPHTDDDVEAIPKPDR